MLVAKAVNSRTWRPRSPRGPIATTGRMTCAAKSSATRAAASQRGCMNSAAA